MSAIDRALQSNARYAETFERAELSSAQNLAVVACMDARLSIEAMLLGLETSESPVAL
jgi:carbonic anhydrase